MLSFMTVALLVYGSMHLYVLGKVWHVLPHTPTLLLAFPLTGIVLTLTPFLVWYLERQGWHDITVAAAWVSYTWMGFLFLFCCIGLALDISRVLTTLLDLRWPLSETAAFKAVSLLSLAALCYGLVEANRIGVETLSLTTPKLASGQVTIAQISDLHLGMMLGGRFLDRVIEKLREIKPDIVVATGDIVDGQGDDFDTLSRRFKQYTPPLGAYAVIGNHEHYVGLDHSLRFLHDAGFTVLRGETAVAGKIIIAGEDDPAAMENAQPAVSDSRNALAAVTANDYIILLKHQPVVDSGMPFDLQLSGHIHGGQIFPFGYLTQLVYHVQTGLTELADGRLLYVNRGTGTWGPPIRLFAPPEITLITIRGETGAPALPQ